MGWIKKVGPACVCPNKPRIGDMLSDTFMLSQGIHPGSQWQCDELDCSKLWEIAPTTPWTWKLVHPGHDNAHYYGD